MKRPRHLISFILAMSLLASAAEIALGWTNRHINRWTGGQYQIPQTYHYPGSISAPGCSPTSSWIYFYGVPQAKVLSGNALLDASDIDNYTHLVWYAGPLCARG